MYTDNTMTEQEQYMIPTKLEFICNTHIHLEVETPLSPARYKCKQCKNKKIHGYSNPDHVSNPFGYLYLAPRICIDCATKMKKCMWC